MHGDPGLTPQLLIAFETRRVGAIAAPMEAAAAAFSLAAVVLAVVALWLFKFNFSVQNCRLH